MMKHFGKNKRQKKDKTSSGKFVQTHVDEDGMYISEARQCLQKGNLKRAGELLGRMVSEDPSNSQALYLYGCLFFLQNNFSEALVYFDAAIVQNPKDAIFYNNKGVALERLGRDEEAIIAYREAVQLNRGYIEPLCNWGGLCERQGHYEDAMTCLTQAIEREPRNGRAHYLLALVHEKVLRWDEAIAGYRQALLLVPNMTEAANSLGNLLAARGRVSEAQQVFEKALQFKKDECILLNNLGNTYLTQGRADQALECYQKAQAVNREGVTAIGSNILLLLNYMPMSGEDVFAQHKQWGLQYPIIEKEQHFSNERNVQRRLRIGYVSPDFYSHSVMYFFEGVLNHHDRKNFEIFLYSAHPYYYDETTARVQKLADGWREIAELSNEDAKQLIQRDKIDILVDLAGHGAKNRLTLFAMKPAPLQVTWIGYPNTTGLMQMDYRFTDRIADPIGETEHLHTEELVRLPQTFLCYSPRTDIGGVQESPVFKKGFITFGSFNNLAKITPPLIALWSAILRAVPKSQLLLKSRGLSDESIKSYMLSLFEKNHIPRERILFAERCNHIREHFDYYHQVDIALDTFPYHGTTTTCDALWMGVPVITLAGKNHVSRVGVSLLHNVGVPEFIASSPNEYIQIASKLANDVFKLEDFRRSLRQKMQLSPLLDGRAMAQNIEIEYRKMWGKWVQTTGQQVGIQEMKSRNDMVKPVKQLKPNPFDAITYYQLATKLKEEQKWEEAIRTYRQVVDIAPEHPEAHASLGALLHHVGDVDGALVHYQKAVGLNPDNYALLNNFAILLKSRGDGAGAIRLLERAVAVKPDYLTAFYQLFLLYQENNDWDQVIVWANKILMLDDKNLEILKQLGIIYKGRGQRQQAQIYLERALAIQPDAVDILNTLGNLFSESGSITEAIATYEKALLLKPDEAITYCNLGSCLAKQGKSTETLECFRKAFKLNPGLVKLHSNILLALAYLENTDPATIYEEHLQWDRNHGAALYPKPEEIAARQRNKSIGQRLKIGYISPDFRNHSVAFFIEPILQEYDREKFEVVLYSDVKFPDATTTRLANKVDLFRNTSRMTDEQVYQVICQDQIDILVDLAGHTADNRMEVFARKPAPVQVTWIGYPNTTGLAAMDYRFTDHYADPVGLTEQFHSEKLVRLKNSFLCYLPRLDSPLVNELPCLEKGYITFGSFNNFNKVSDQVVALWGEILNRVPHSRLLIKSAGFADPYVCNKTIEKFNKLGISQERIIMQGQIPSYQEHLSKYHAVDIALDTYPYHGTTTTCEALWMGVPVVTLAGRTHVSRVGVSLLSNVGLADCIAVSQAEYINIAVDMAVHTRRLKNIREKLRTQMQCSALMQASQFTENLESVYHELWYRYLERMDENLPENILVYDKKKIDQLLEEANVATMSGKLEEAKILYEEIIQRNPHHTIALHGLGLLMGQSGDVDKGIFLLKKAISIDSGYFEAIYNLGMFYRKNNDLQEAIECLEQASELRPQHMGANINLARSYQEIGRADKASTFYRQSLQISPDCIEVIFEVSYFLSLCGKGSHAIEVINKGLRVDPENTSMLQMMGFAYKMSGNAAKALEYYRRAVEIDPGFVECHSNILSTFNYLPNYNSQMVFQEHRAWGEQHANHLRKYSTYNVEKTKNKRLKIGYVSADFRGHSVAYFLQSVLQNYDHTKFQVVLYNNGTIIDDVSKEFKALTDQWVDIYNLSDEDAAKRIHEDGIDILIDLSGHTGGNRLLVFAYKPAPIQVTWIGYPNTTGIDAMDYRITDCQADPVGMTQEFYTEELVRLPNCFLCYSPKVSQPEKPFMPYLNQSGVVTFGSFNNLAKLNPQLLILWSKILKSVPNSRLVLKAIGLAELIVQENIKQFFEAQGIEGTRIVLSGHKVSLLEHMKMYEEIDIALDYFPYNGTTTTCEALWMGVPVVTLAGNSHVSRVGASLLHYAGFPELIANSEEGYVQLAVNLALDTQRLQVVRERLHKNIKKSLLLEAVEFTAGLEKVYLEFWERWVDHATV